MVSLKRGDGKSGRGKRVGKGMTLESFQNRTGLKARIKNQGLYKKTGINRSRESEQPQDRKALRKKQEKG